MTDKKSGFFAIGKPQWAEVCDMGLNQAAGYLVIACGTGPDNQTTSWSAEAVANKTGMSWRRAKAALTDVDRRKTIVAGITRKGGNPKRKLVIPKEPEHRLWLPNSLVAGAGREVAPVAKLRQGQNLEYLQTAIELYDMQDLAGDGGLPRSLVVEPFERELICERGPFIVYGFNRKSSRTCWTNQALGRFHGRKDGDQSAAWTFLETLERIGMLETVHYLAESDSPDSELLHPLTGDHLADGVRDAAGTFAAELPDGFNYQAERYDYTLPILQHIGNAAVVGISRLVYRPHTKMTAAWQSHHRDSCRTYEAVYAALAVGDFEQAVKLPECRHQGYIKETSRKLQGT